MQNEKTNNNNPKSATLSRRKSSRIITNEYKSDETSRQRSVEWSGVEERRVRLVQIAIVQRVLLYAVIHVVRY